MVALRPSTLSEIRIRGLHPLARRQTIPDLFTWEYRPYPPPTHSPPSRPCIKQFRPGAIMLCSQARTVLSSQCLTPLWSANRYWLSFGFISGVNKTNTSGLRFSVNSCHYFFNCGDAVLVGPSDSATSCRASNSSLREFLEGRERQTKEIPCEYTVFTNHNLLF